MRVANWLELQPTQNDIESLNGATHDVIPTRKLRQLLVRTILQQYPWKGRKDLIPVYGPSQSYSSVKWIAILKPDPRAIHPIDWEIVRVISIEIVNNPVQGKFQVLTLELGKKRKKLVASLTGAKHPLADLSGQNDDDLESLIAMIEDRYRDSLQATLEKLARAKKLNGEIVGECFIPTQIESLETSQLQRFFENLSLVRPYVDNLEIINGLPALSDLPTETAQALVEAALLKGGYHSLGGGRWTTDELYEQINRDIPRGLPVPRVRSKLDIWTEKDEQDLGGVDPGSLPEEEQQILEDEETFEWPTYKPSIWQPITQPVRLPTLSYLHITQAYFPIGKIGQAFAPDVQMVMVQLISGGHEPFLVDRHLEMLKALNREKLRIPFLDAGIPAGTHLWLEYQGGERYRVAPRPLPEARMVPCKLAYLQDGHLHIEHTEIAMEFEGDPSVFKAELRFSDIEALFEEARRCQLSVLDAMIQSVQELCATDPQGRAHRLDIFNAVFLKRMCSPASVSVLLSRPCFIPLGDGYYRFVDLDAPAPPRKRRPSKKRPKPITSEPSTKTMDVDVVVIPVLEPEIETEPGTPEQDTALKTVDDVVIQPVPIDAPEIILAEEGYVPDSQTSDQSSNTPELMPESEPEPLLVGPMVPETLTSVPVEPEPLLGVQAARSVALSDKKPLPKKPATVTGLIWSLLKHGFTYLRKFLWRRNG